MSKTDPRIVTYSSGNADPQKRWLAFIVAPNGDYLPVRFPSSTEEQATALAQAEWDKHKAERDANIAAREEGRRKAAETRARRMVEA